MCTITVNEYKIEESMKKITDILSNDYEDENDDKPDVRGSAELVPFSPTAEVTRAIEDFKKQVKEALAVSPVDWPKGRTLELNLKFAVVPISLEAKVGQE